MDSQHRSAPPPPPPPQYISHHLTQAHHNLPNNLQNPPPFPFNPMNPPPADHQQPGGGFAVDPAKKKRGRPRKYSQEDSIGLGLSPQPSNHVSSALAEPSDTPAKKHRGRPPGSGKKQMNALGVPGVGFTPHVITVKAGEDIATKVMAFSQQGPRTVCIMSANGTVCNVTIRQPSMSGGTVTYEGRFDIITMTGSFPSSDDDGNGSSAVGLRVSLAGSDNRVLGGEVAGILKAATPVQVIVGSFVTEGKKPKHNGPSMAGQQPSQMLNFGSPSVGGSTESAEDDSPLSHNSGPYGNPGQPMPMYPNMGWPNSIKLLPD